MKNIMFAYVFFLACVLAVNISAATYYVDSTAGDDSNTGLSEQAAWQTLSKVNSTTFSPGDSILFKRGEYWRGQLKPSSSGSEAGGYITYGAYGSRALSKPTILGSAPRNETDEWENESGNIWKTLDIEDMGVIGDELIVNPSFDSDLNDWNFYTTIGASRTRDITTYDSSPACYRVGGGTDGTTTTQTQLYTTSMSLEQGKYYLLTFRAKVSVEFDSYNVKIIKNGSPYTQYSEQSFSIEPITTSWQTYRFVFRSLYTVDDASVRFLLGLLPESESFWLDSVSLKECENIPLVVDVGNIIFNDGASCGNRVWDEADLTAQGDFFYDEDNYVVKLYSIADPSSCYDDIDLAMKRHIVSIDEKSYIRFENLHMSNGAAHGINGTNVGYIHITDCDVSFMGGHGFMIMTTTLR